MIIGVSLEGKWMILYGNCLLFLKRRINHGNSFGVLQHPTRWSKSSDSQRFVFGKKNYMLFIIYVYLFTICPIQEIFCS